MGREDGWKIVAAQRLCPSHCGVWAHLKMAPCPILLLFVLLQATPADNQRLSFWVKNICNQQEQLKPNGEARNPYSMVGCNMTMICQYRDEDDCKQRTSTRLTVKRCFSLGNCTYDVKNMIIPESSRTKCIISVLFVNMTVDMQGNYYCEDRDFLDNENTAFLERDIRVGYCPQKPTNISFIYRPRKSIDIILNPRNTSHELRAQTMWIVNYDWSGSGFTLCSGCSKQDIMCKLISSGLCTPCSLRLKKYAWYGQYNNMGSILLPFTVMIQVRNIYDTTDPVIVSTHLLNWVKPDPIYKITQLNASSTSVHLKVTPPLKSIDDFHLRHMKRSQIPGQPPGCPLWLTYTISPLSAKDQNLRTSESKFFLEKHGFVRNMEDDQRAFEEVKDTTYGKTLYRCWDNTNQCESSEISEAMERAEEYLEPLCFWLGNLPRADTVYNVTFFLHSRYSSDPMMTNVTTGESAPERGPALDDNFAFCPSDSQISNDFCTKCLIYFKEIPVLWRGGRILNYSLTLELVVDSHLCGESNQTLWTNGNSNTFYVPNLSTASEYKITIIAHNKQGPSPATVRTFVAQPSSYYSLAPRNVTVEKSKEPTLYKVSWKDGLGFGKARINGTYFVHYCFAGQLTDLALYNITVPDYEAPMFLNCLTNMVTKKESTDHIKMDIIIKQAVRNATGLKPVFFVSLLTEDGRRSGLVGVDRFYSPDTTGSNSIVDDEGSLGYLNGQSVHFGLPRETADNSSVGVTALIVSLILIFILCIAVMKHWYHKQAKKFGKSFDILPTINLDETFKKSEYLPAESPVAKDLVGFKFVQALENPFFNHLSEQSDFFCSGAGSAGCVQSYEQIVNEQSSSSRYLSNWNEEFVIDRYSAWEASHANSSVVMDKEGSNVATQK